MHTNPQSPLHERNALLGRIRARVRGQFFELLGRIARTDDGRAILHGALTGVADAPHGLGLNPGVTPPYAGLGRLSAEPTPCRRDDVVIITARFRSGSTLLWNLFREIPSCTSYYEPFNERRWFDPDHRQGHTDPTHRGVSDYWREYESLPHLAELYREEWIDRRLFLSDRAWEPAMKAYVDELIARAPGRPVLQFNRLDFRLPWIRRTYPRATVVHLYRHPRDAWMSSLVDPARYPQHATMAAFDNADHFYLLRWARDLRHTFPFLDPILHEHAYDLYYLVWKLSYLFGARFAHQSVSFEDLVTHPETVLTGLLDHLGIRDAEAGHLATLVDPPGLGKWRQYADEEWFTAREARCERVLEAFFGNGESAETDPAPRTAVLPVLTGTSS